MPSTPLLRTVELFQLHITSEPKEKIADFLEDYLDQGSKEQTLIVTTPNPEQIVQAVHDPEFQKALQSSDILLPDGVGIVGASWMLKLFKSGSPIPERVTGIDITIRLLQKAQEKNWKVLVLGGREYGDLANDAPTAVQILPQFLKNQAAQTNVWWTEGFADVRHPQESETKRVEKIIRELQPEILFVAFGAPFQEKWIFQNAPLLKAASVGVAMVVGGSFDVLTGQLPRAPHFFQIMGLEWLYRLIQQPWRWRRQLRLVSFGLLTLKEMFQ